LAEEEARPLIGGPYALILMAVYNTGADVIISRYTVGSWPKYNTAAHYHIVGKRPVVVYRKIEQMESYGFSSLR
jgi:hypothetical protein